MYRSGARPELTHDYRIGINPKKPIRLNTAGYCRKKVAYLGILQMIAPDQIVQFTKTSITIFPRHALRFY